MFGIGSGEMLVFAVVVLIALGPKRLPDFMRTVGKGLREIRKATTDLRKHSGIDELMRDDPAGLRALSRDISRAPAPRREQKLSAADLAKEAPVEGVDIAHAHHLAKKNAELTSKEAAVARDTTAHDAAPDAAPDASVVVAATVAIESTTPDPADLESATAGFEGDTVPDKTEVSPRVRHEPTMMGIPAVDPYALPAKKSAGKVSVPPPPPKSSTSKSAATSTDRSSVPPPPARRSVPPPPPPRRIAPSDVLSGARRASLPPSIPPPAPSLPPSAPPAALADPNEKPNARDATMAIEVEDLTLEET